MVIDRFLEREKLVEPFLSFWWRNWYPILVSFCFPVTTWFVIGVKSTAIVFLDYLHPLSSKTGLTLLLSLWLEQMLSFLMILKKEEKRLFLSWTVRKRGKVLLWTKIARLKQELSASLEFPFYPCFLCAFHVMFVLLSLQVRRLHWMSSVVLWFLMWFLFSQEWKEKAKKEWGRIGNGYDFVE